MTSDEIQQIFKEIDSEGNGYINFTEFLGATSEIIFNDSQLLTVFKQFDTD
jgi:Ca2+-binding EF-hand superfamily protein